jgi:hypothetical protein
MTLEVRLVNLSSGHLLLCLSPSVSLSLCLSIISISLFLFLPQIFKEPLYRRYYATTASLAWVYTLFYVFLLIFLPLFIAYNSSCNDQPSISNS